MRRDRADILRNSNSGFGFTLKYEKGKYIQLYLRNSKLYFCGWKHERF